MAETRYKEKSASRLHDADLRGDASRQQPCHLFGAVIQCAKSLDCVGAWAYEMRLPIDSHFNHLQACLGLRCWKLSKDLKPKVKRALEAALLPS